MLVDLAVSEGAPKGWCLVGGGVGSCTTRFGASTLSIIVSSMGVVRAEKPGSVLVAIEGREGGDLAEVAGVFFLLGVGGIAI